MRRDLLQLRFIDVALMLVCRSHRPWPKDPDSLCAALFQRPVDGLAKMVGSSHTTNGVGHSSGSQPQYKGSAHPQVTLPRAAAVQNLEPTFKPAKAKSRNLSPAWADQIAGFHPKLPSGCLLHPRGRNRPVSTWSRGEDCGENSPSCTRETP